MSKRGFRFVRDPASGALIVPPELDAKIQKAIRRSARMIAFRLYLGSFGLEFRIFAFEVRRALLKARRYLLRVEAWRRRREFLAALPLPSEAGDE